MKLFMLIPLFFLTTSVFAETCPNVLSIQEGRLGEWHVFDSDNGEPLNASELLAYEAKVNHFSLAAYYYGAPEGPAQCYYDGVTDHEYLNAYLARQDLFPDFQHGNWQSKSGHEVCYAALTSCPFL